MIIGSGLGLWCWTGTCIQVSLSLPVPVPRSREHYTLDLSEATASSGKFLPAEASLPESLPCRAACGRERAMLRGRREFGASLERA